MENQKVTIYTHFNREVHKKSSAPNLKELEEKAELVDYEHIKYPAEINSDYNSLPTYPARPHFQQEHLNMKPATQVVVFDGCPKDPYHPASMPIYQTATFVQPSATEFGPYDYTRSGNPTRTALETLVAGLENAHSAFAFSSGMAALSTITRLLTAGQEIIAGTDLYGGTYRLLTKVAARNGIKITFVDVTDLEKVRSALSPNTKLLHMESPSNPLMRITDIKALANLLHQHSVLLSIDSTMMTPILQRPLDLGADLVMHSGTKFLSGHSDTMMGIVCVSSANLAKEIAFFQNAEGTGLAPFDCWLILRGIKTLALRVERAQENALKVAQFLNKHPLIKDVHYSGLEPTEEASWQNRDRSFEVLKREYEIQRKQAKGGGSVLSFTTGDAKLSQVIVDALTLFKVTVSFGSCNSLVELPCLLSHASIPAEQRTLPPDLVRLSIGIESIEDILNDLTHALQSASHFLNRNC